MLTRSWKYVLKLLRKYLWLDWPFLEDCWSEDLRYSESLLSIKWNHFIKEKADWKWCDCSLKMLRYTLTLSFLAFRTMETTWLWLPWTPFTPHALFVVAGRASQRASDCPPTCLDLHLASPGVNTQGTDCPFESWGQRTKQLLEKLRNPHPEDAFPLTQRAQNTFLPNSLLANHPKQVARGAGRGKQAGSISRWSMKSGWRAKGLHKWGFRGSEKIRVYTQSLLVL